jgi:hypothetical protein
MKLASLQQMLVKVAEAIGRRVWGVSFDWTDMHGMEVDQGHAYISLVLG